MKIFQTANRGSIVLFLKILFTIMALFGIFKFAEFVYDFSGFDDIEYKNPDHVLKVFEENENDFDSVVDVLKETNINSILFDDFMNNPKPIMLCPGDSLKNPRYQIGRKGLLANEQYHAICSFFEKYGPLYIEGTLEFCFAFNTTNDVVYLIYVPQENKGEIIDYYSNYTITHLKDDWYFATYE